MVENEHEIFVCGGQNVDPIEVEKVLCALPGVREAAVIGIPHPKWGECGKAFLSFEDGQSLSIEDIREHCLGHLSPQKVPTKFTIVKELPRLATGVVDKTALV